MTLKPNSLVTISGDAYSRGRSYGSQARDMIRRNVDFYLNWWERKLAIPPEEALQIAGRFAAAAGNYDAQILEEMQGIAAGAELTLEHILAVNARYEFSFAHAHAAEGPQQLPPAECTSLAAVPPATTNGHTLIGQNWDNSLQLKPVSLLLEIRQKDGPTIVAHVEAGLLMHKGMNSAGLGACVNALLSENDRLEPKVPFYVIFRAIMNSTSLEEAQQAVLRADRTSSGNFLLATDKGRILDLEMSPTSVRSIGPEHGRLAHANVFAEADGQDPVVDKFRVLYPQLHTRYLRAGELLGQGQLDVQAFKNIFSDHINSPESICRHLDHRPPDAPEGLAWETITSIIMDLTERTIYLTDGPPCSTEYRELSFDSLRQS